MRKVMANYNYLVGKLLFRNINALPGTTKEIFIKRHTLTILNIGGQ